MWKQEKTKKAVFSASPSPLLPGLCGQGIIPIVITDTDEITLWKPPLQKKPGAVIPEGFNNLLSD